MKLSKMIPAAIAVLFLSGAAIAEPKEFPKADANGDGMVDSAEFANSGVDKDMKSLDTDKNGNLNEDEYSVVLEEECE